MKKSYKFLVIAIIWILFSCYFFSVNRVGAGMAWLLVGIFNLLYSLFVNHVDKKVQEIKKQSDETVSVTDEQEVYEEECGGEKTVLEVIEPANEVHTIYDEYIGYGYDVDKVFKPAKSHAGEVALLCTYAPGKEYGTEGDFPYIAVQDCDEVYCAIEEYKESQNFEGAISIEPQNGLFMFRAKREYYGNIMYFYGFEFDDDEYWNKAGLCLVYSKAYVGSESEETLINILDVAAQTFRNGFIQE